MFDERVIQAFDHLLNNLLHFIVAVQFCRFTIGFVKKYRLFYKKTCTNVKHVSVAWRAANNDLVIVVVYNTCVQLSKC